MKYKGYVGNVVYDDEAKIFHGEVIGLKDIITFQGKSVSELEQAFMDSIDDYLEWCQEQGEQKEEYMKQLKNTEKKPPHLRGGQDIIVKQKIAKIDEELGKI